MKTNNKQEVLLTQALAAFEEITNESASIVSIDSQTPSKNANATIQLGATKNLHAKIYFNLTLTSLGQSIAQLEYLKKPRILISRYITPQIAERLKEIDIQFLDTFGNVYVRNPRQFIYVTGRKAKKLTGLQKPIRAFRSTGIKVIFSLLCQPEMVVAPYRNIADASGVALGSVGWIIKDLIMLGFLNDSKATGRRIINKQKLIEEWVTAFHRELRPKLHPLRFHASDQKWWQNANWRHYNTCLGGEPAAAVLTAHLKPQQLIIYSQGSINKLLTDFRLRSDSNGEIEILDAFWKLGPKKPNLNFVPPLLIYADLLATTDARNLETARKIYDQYLN